MTLAEALTWGVQELQASSDTYRLDAEILLTEVLHCSRSYLIAHAKRSLTEIEQDQYKNFIARRKQSEPLAYIVGHKEFWSLDFKVTPAVLVPRPETELLVELLLQFFSESEAFRRVADLGTGCGAVALALSHERPAWELCATDRSPAALEVAAQNAAALRIKGVQFFEGSWCEALPALYFDAILSNPPYLSENELKSCPKELSFEPVSALVSSVNGLGDIMEIAAAAKKHLCPGGYLLIEHGASQAAEVRKILQKESYGEVASYHDIAGIERVTGGRWTR